MTYTHLGFLNAGIAIFFTCISSHLKMTETDLQFYDNPNFILDCSKQLRTLKGKFSLYSCNILREAFSPFGGINRHSYVEWINILPSGCWVWWTYGSSSLPYNIKNKNNKKMLQRQLSNTNRCFCHWKLQNEILILMSYRTQIFERFSLYLNRYIITGGTVMCIAQTTSK